MNLNYRNEKTKMKYFKKILGDRIYLSPRCIEDAEKFTEWMMVLII